MITNGGKEIIAKYMLGQAPAYATHISLGCGALPNDTTDYSDRETMMFEMVRVPISSRGFVNEGGVSKLALAAEIPTEYRYEITEVALWSAGSNPSAANNSDSKVLFTFDEIEGWQLHKTESGGSTGPIVLQTAPLDGGDDTNDINVTDAIFAALADNASMMSAIRRDRQEGSRFLDYTIFMRGDTSSIDSSFNVTDGSVGNSSHIHLDGRSFNFANNSPNDEIKIALSVVPKYESATGLPYRTRVVVEFLQSEATPTVGYARLKAEIADTDLAADNHYYVITQPLSALETSANFSWKDVRVVRIYTSVYKTNGDLAPTSEYYVALDAIRFDNISSVNPLYCMSGYSVVNTALVRPIVKVANTSNYIEFRLTLGVA